MKKYTLPAILLLFLFAACDKLSNPVDDITATQKAATKYSKDQTAQTALTNLVMDVANNDPNMQKKGTTYGYLPDEAKVVWFDSVFTDGDGVLFVIDLGTLDTLASDFSAKVFSTQDGGLVKGQLLCYASSHMDEVGAQLFVSAVGGVFYMHPNQGDDLIMMGNVSIAVSGPTEKAYVDKLSAAADSNFYGVENQAYNYNLIRVTREDVNQIKTNVSYFPLGIEWADLDKFEFRAIYRGTVVGNYTINQTEGASTSDILDDVYNITGASESDGDQDGNYNVTINTPLILKSKTCAKIPVQGTLTFKAAKTADIDYGDGTCDNKVKITVSKITKEVEL
ncbi:MAG: hypothetical protein GC180_06825 [Bacteroidetes bacterium]|nr:hypothetical protein [Bacteroidota bacterium]